MIGTQVYGLKTEFEQDFEGTLEKIARMGFTRIEPLVIPIDEQLPILPMDMWSFALLGRAQQAAESLGLSMKTVHVGAGLGSPDQPDRIIADSLLKIREIAGTDGFVFSGMFSDLEGARRCGEHLAVIAEYVKDAGCTVIYHNHNDEWALIETGQETMPAMDLFYRFAGPDVMLELDIGWTALVRDELQTAAAYADRIVELHCRDFSDEAFSGKYTRQTMPARCFVPVGTGRVKVREIMEAAKAFPHFGGDYIVEQEQSDGSMLESMERSLRTMQGWLSQEPGYGKGGSI